MLNIRRCIIEEDGRNRWRVETITDGDLMIDLMLRLGWAFGRRKHFEESI